MEKGGERLYFASLPDLKRLRGFKAAYVGGGENTSLQPKCCRELLFTLPEVIVSPSFENKSHLFIISQDQFAAMQDFPRKLKNLNIKLVSRIEVDSEFFQYCLTYTIYQRLAPIWNRTASFLAKGKSFLQECEKMSAVNVEITITDKICLAIKSLQVKMQPPKVEDFMIDFQSLWNFKRNPYYQIPSHAIQDHRCCVLPSLKKGKVHSITHSIPSKAPFKSYSEMKQHWKLTYGYRLPTDDCHMFFNVQFFGETVFTYPEWCIRKQEPIRYFRCDHDAICREFIDDLASRLPEVCNTPLRFTKDALNWQRSFPTADAGPKSFLARPSSMQPQSRCTNNSLSVTKNNVRKQGFKFTKTTQHDRHNPYHFDRIAGGSGAKSIISNKTNVYKNQIHVQKTKTNVDKSYNRAERVPPVKNADDNIIEVSDSPLLNSSLSQIVPDFDTSIFEDDSMFADSPMLNSDKNDASAGNSSEQDLRINNDALARNSNVQNSQLPKKKAPSNVPSRPLQTVPTKENNLYAGKKSESNLSSSDIPSKKSLQRVPEKATSKQPTLHTSLVDEPNDCVPDILSATTPHKSKVSEDVSTDTTGSSYLSSRIESHYEGRSDTEQGKEKQMEQNKTDDMAVPVDNTFKAEASSSATKKVVPTFGKRVAESSASSQSSSSSGKIVPSFKKKKARPTSTQPSQSINKSNRNVPNFKPNMTAPKSKSGITAPKNLESNMTVPSFKSNITAASMAAINFKPKPKPDTQGKPAVNESTSNLITINPVNSNSPATPNPTSTSNKLSTQKSLINTLKVSNQIQPNVKQTPKLTNMSNSQTFATLKSNIRGQSSLALDLAMQIVSQNTPKKPQTFVEKTPSKATSFGDRTPSTNLLQSTQTKTPMVQDSMMGKTQKVTSMSTPGSVQKNGSACSSQQLPDSTCSPGLVKKKKERSKPKVQLDVNVEDLTRKRMLSKVNLLTLKTWLKEKGVACKSSEKKPELVLKAEQLLGVLQTS